MGRPETYGEVERGRFYEKKKGRKKRRKGKEGKKKKGKGERGRERRAGAAGFCGIPARWPAVERRGRFNLPVAPRRTAPHRTAPHRTAPHRTAPRRAAPREYFLGGARGYVHDTQATLEN